MCMCKNIEMGSYDNQVSIFIPEEGHIMSKYMNNRRKARLSRGRMICVDACLENEILNLWNLGIETTGCCCGHNEMNGFIGVSDKYIDIMKKIGYEVAYNPCRPGDEDSFYPKTVERIQD